MIALIWGGIIATLGFFVHVIVWRLNVPKASGRALFLIFGATIFLGLGLLWMAASNQEVSIFVPGTVLSLINTGCVAATLSLAYIASYPALEAESPSLVICAAVDKSGQKGVPIENLFELLTEERVMVPRISELKAEGLVAEQNGKIALTRNGKTLGLIFIKLRKILRLSKGG